MLKHREERFAVGDRQPDILGSARRLVERRDFFGRGTLLIADLQQNPDAHGTPSKPNIDPAFHNVRSGKPDPRRQRLL